VTKLSWPKRATAALLAGALGTAPLVVAGQDAVAHARAAASHQQVGRGEDPGTPSHRCASYTPLRRPLFGDLHVHTSLSFDANSLGVRNMPPAAYRFAKGDQIGLQPYDEAGKPLRHAKLERPLDFAAVTDHSELLGELRICHTPGTPGYDSMVCRIQRRWPLLAYIFVSSRMLNSADPKRYSFCGRNGEICRQAAAGPWQEIRDAAAEAYDQTDACSFTSFVAYEWSGGPGGNMTHRNVIFADEHAPDLPVSFIDESTGEGLWKHLDQDCRKSGCRYITIPHNTNLSNGMLFNTETPTREDAERRRRLEPLLEVIQHKGDSECRAGAADELCSFEKLPFSRMQEQPFHVTWKQPGPLSFAREILGEGLVRESRLGLNPFRLGMIGSTDTHLAAAGLTAEKGYPGHGAGGDTSATEVPRVADSVWFNPGGLAVVWAEENSRESIWAALNRREVYATSGPRMIVRFFGGFDYPDNLCNSMRFAEDGYAGGVPMGGELHQFPDQPKAPVFAVSALQDAGTKDSPGTALDRLQIVKIWYSGGSVHEKTIDVTTGAGASDLDASTCAPTKSGSASLCATWRDTEYDPKASALYYARVVEQPSCRWTGFACAAVHADCRHPGSLPEGFAFCCDAAVAKTVQERAITSPIWLPTGPPK
jgi:hypothetical protein